MLKPCWLSSALDTKKDINLFVLFHRHYKYPKRNGNILTYHIQSVVFSIDNGLPVYSYHICTSCNCETMLSSPACRYLAMDNLNMKKNIPQLTRLIYRGKFHFGVTVERIKDRMENSLKTVSQNCNH